MSKESYEIAKIMCGCFSDGTCVVNGCPCEINNCVHKEEAEKLYGAGCRKVTYCNECKYW